MKGILVSQWLLYSSISERVANGVCVCVNANVCMRVRAFINTSTIVSNFGFERAFHCYLFACLLSY